MSRFGIVALIGLWCGVARAGAREDFAFSLEQHTGNDFRTSVITKLVTLNVGPKCLAKLADPKLSVVETAAGVATDIAEYAKHVTGEDWSAMESLASDKAKARQLIASAVDAFKPRFALTINVEGDDCDARSTSLWLRYWAALAELVKEYPPPSGKAFITLDVTSKAKQVSYSASKDGTTFKLTAPRDIEPTEWLDSLGHPFRQLVAGLPDDFAFALFEYVHEYSRMWMITRFTTFNVGKKCLARFPDKTQAVLASSAQVASHIANYARQLGADDWSTIESQRNNDPKTNQALASKSMDAFRPKLAVTINVEGDDCDAKDRAMWLQYWVAIATALDSYPPKAAKVAIVLDVRTNAKGVTSTIGKDGSFIFTAARDIEPNNWLEPIELAFKRAAGH